MKNKEAGIVGWTVVPFFEIELVFLEKHSADESRFTGIGGILVQYLAKSNE